MYMAVEVEESKSGKKSTRLFNFFGYLGLDIALRGATSPCPAPNAGLLNGVDSTMVVDTPRRPLEIRLYDGDPGCK